MQNATIVKDRPWAVADFNSKGFCEIVLIDKDEPSLVADFKPSAFFVQDVTIVTGRPSLVADFKSQGLPKSLPGASVPPGSLVPVNFPDCIRVLS